MRLMKGIFLVAVSAGFGALHAADAGKPPEPYCFGSPFGVMKVDTSTALPRLAPAGTFEQEAAVDREARGKITVLNKRLKYIPPEIERIRRGYTSSFVGGGLNTGLSEWFGIDLERHVIVQVVRRFYNDRDSMMRPFADVDFEKNPHAIGRKWQGDHETEEEVVLLSQGRLQDLELFVCSANALWAHHQPLPSPADSPLPPVSDAMSAYLYLLDLSKDQKEVVLKQARYGDPVDMAAQVVRSYVERIQW